MSTSGHIEFDLSFSTDGAVGPRDADQPFHIAVLGDFSGRAQRDTDGSDPGLEDREIHRVDRDDLDDLVSKLAPRLSLHILDEPSSAVSIQFEQLDDFHPDRLLVRSDLFKRLLEIRARLADSSSFDEAAHEVRRWLTGEDSPGVGIPAPPGSPPPRRDAGTDLVSELLSERESEVRKREQAAGIDVEGLVAGVVRRHARPDVEADQQRLLLTVDTAIGAEMRRVLHDPLFQNLEAGWRGIDFLVRRLGADSCVRVYVIDVSKEELRKNLSSTGPDAFNSIDKLLVEPSGGMPGGTPWALLVGNYSFDGSSEDTRLLDALAQTARRAGAPFVAEAGPRYLGCDSLKKSRDPDSWKPLPDPEDRSCWEAFRRRPAASWVGLVLPRMLMRLPYGSRSHPVAYFGFEEIEGAGRHGEYLWGNSAFACACLLGTAFSEEGWRFDPADYRELSDMPTHVYRETGRAIIKPPTEVWLSDRAIREVVSRGLMPLYGIKDTPSVRLPVFVSVADPGTRLSGSWRTDAG